MTANFEERLRHKASTIADAVYESLKQSILNLDFEPGEKLSEMMLAQIFGVSKAPVRDALQRLQQENLVQIRPQAGTFVSLVPSRAKALEICQVRLLLEPYAAETAAQFIQDKDKQTLSQAFELMDTFDLAAKEFTQVHKRVDLLLHSTIWRLCGNNEIQTILANYQYEVHRIRISTARLVTARLEESIKEHKAILAALLCNDPHACSASMHLHVQNLRQAVIQVFEEQDSNI